MRALSALLPALALLAAGCLAPATPLDPLTTLPSPPGPLVVHRAGQVLDLAPSAVLGAAPEVAARLLGEVGAEPNVGVTSSGAVFVTAFDLVMRSRDLGMTWEPVYEFGMTPVGVDLRSDSDPMLWVDPLTDRIFAPMMWPPLVCSEAAYSDDEGETWTERPMGCFPTFPYDHQKLATGPYVEDSPLASFRLPTSDYPNVVYLCYNHLQDTRCQLSTDGGFTYVLDRQVQTGCGGLNGHPATAPNGTVYLPLGLSCDTPFVAVSEDNGLSWDLRELHVGGLGNAEVDAEVTVTPNGMAYFLTRSSVDHRPYLVRSADSFHTVSHPYQVAPPDVLSTRFVALASGDDGKLVMAYLGTRDTASRPNQVYDDARWHLFVTYTVDAEADEPTFVTVQVTPEDDPVQIGYSWEGGGGDPGRNLLDFIDAVVGPDGRAYVAFTDGCTEDCAGNPAATKDQSRSRDAALAVQLAGPALRTVQPAPAEEAARAGLPAGQGLAGALASA